MSRYVLHVELKADAEPIEGWVYHEAETSAAAVEQTRTQWVALFPLSTEVCVRAVAGGFA